MTRRFDAVCFDLYGTLVDEISSGLDAIMERIADTLGLPLDELVYFWQFESRHDRDIGRYRTDVEALSAACEALGVTASPDRLTEAAGLRQAFMSSCFIPRPDAKFTLAAIRSAGLATALVSNCSAGTPERWKRCELGGMIDHLLFSNEVGILKPDPAIYHLALERLGVSADRCLYVGDGSSNELDGAAAVGMSPLLLRVDHEDIDRHAVARRQMWDGPVVGSLSEVLGYLE